jgi:hypothetical protein
MRQWTTVSEVEATYLTPGRSDNNGMAKATWQTKKPSKIGQGGTTLSSYTATVSNVTADGYTWDGVMTSTQPFLIE